MKFINNKKKLYLSLLIVFLVYILDRITKIYVLHLSQGNFETRYIHLNI